MSKSTLIIFCHFIVLGLFAFATLDRHDARTTEVARLSRTDPDVIDVLEQSLVEGRATREQLQEQLAQAQEAVRQRDQLLASGDVRMREALANLQRTEAEARQLFESRAQLEQQRLLLEAQLAAKETNLVALGQKAQNTQASLELLQKQHGALRGQQEQLRQAYDAARSEVTRLEGQLANAASEAKITAEVLSALQEDLRRQVALSGQMPDPSLAARKPSAKEKRPGRERDASVPPPAEFQFNQGEQLKFQQEAARLSETPARSVGNATAVGAAPALRARADVGGVIVTEILFNDFNANRVPASFQVKRSGVFGQTVRKETTPKPILLAQGAHIFAICHIEETPLALEAFPADWTGFTATLGRPGALLSVPQIMFLDRDPRVVLIPLDQSEAGQLGCKLFPIAVNPSKYEEGILMGTTRSYYGEATLQVDPSNPRYVRLPRERFTRVSTRFTPARGDLLFSRTGEALGIMVNKEYCLLLDDFTCTRAINTGAIFQQPAPLLSEMYQQLIGFPTRLQ